MKLKTRGLSPLSYKKSKNNIKRNKKEKI